MDQTRVAMPPMMRAGLCAALAVGALALMAGSAVADDHARGKQLFQFCQQCHGPEGQGMPLALAPSIAGQELWYLERQLGKFRKGQRGGHPDDVAGMRMRPMSRWLRSEEDVKAVAAYIASLPPNEPKSLLSGGDATKGKQIYALCGTCHGPNGEGMKVMNGPKLTAASDWYMLTQLNNFKAGVRGAAAGDIEGAMMRPMAMTLADEQAMKDVIAHIMTLSE